MIVDWEMRLLEASRRRNEADEKEFLELVDAVAGRCTLQAMRVLMKTFSAKPDYGTQERVLSVMSGGSHRDAVKAILEELPRLVVEAREWADTLVITEFTHRRAMLIAAAKEMPEDIKDALRVVLQSEDFRDEFSDTDTTMLG